MPSSTLTIYLNDHLAGATAGLELFRRAARTQRGTPAGPELARLTAEVTEDRDSLLSVMRRLGVPVRQYKVLGGWVGEKVGRVKLNGHLLTRSPLSNLVELEALRLGVEGKGAGWRLLRAVAEQDPRLDPADLDRLVERAQDQVGRLEALRMQAGRAALAA